MLAYSGFLLVVNPFNSGAQSQAKKIITNTVVGIVIALSAWLIVDAIMAVLYHPTDPALAGSAWYSLVNSGGLPVCILQAGALNTLNNANITPGVDVTGISSSGTVSGQCSASNTACSPASLQAAGYTAGQAQALSCIAVTESSGNPNTPNSPTGACGTFQVVQGNWNQSSLHQGSCSSATSCNDPTCNLQAAYLLSQQAAAKGQSVFQPWTCANCNSKAQGCINQYDPSGT